MAYMYSGLRANHYDVNQFLILPIKISLLMYTYANQVINALQPIHQENWQYRRPYTGW